MATFSRPESPIATGRRPTITDVARAAGVSIAVVSYALNGRPGVSERTRRRVLQVAEDLGWRPSAAARALRGTPGTVALLLVRDTVGATSADADLELADGLRDVLGADLPLAVHLVESPSAAAAAIATWWAEHRYDAFVMTGIRTDDPRLAVVERLGVVAVLVDHVSWPRPADLDDGRGAPRRQRPAGPPHTMSAAAWAPRTVALDAAADVKVGRHLGDLGHRHVAVLAPATPLRSGHGAADAVGEEVDRRGGITIVEPCTTLEDVATTARRLLAAPDRPTAIVTSDDHGALVGRAVARRSGLAVPWDVSVVAGRDAPVLRLSTPPVTAVARPLRALGQEAGRQVLHAVGRHGGGSPDDVASRTVPGGRLVIRGTTAPPR
ncbi:LacI family DNA-binding transcriptional regulator [Oerskovia rustica]|uniref:LacI family DNA-binding transcriptional regulator n=1 Tax=Oerskovia rustica TaxID=2762237 RepID=A0ABR8RQM7_9CELL|nr:LacI family DNA-binding transcriptional regulator [Oerskovia rustica]